MGGEEKIDAHKEMEIVHLPEIMQQRPKITQQQALAQHATSAAEKVDAFTRYAKRHGMIRSAEIISKEKEMQDALISSKSDKTKVKKEAKDLINLSNINLFNSDT